MRKMIDYSSSLSLSQQQGGERESPLILQTLGDPNEKGSNPGQFKMPIGVCVTDDDQTLCVVDCNNHRVQLF